MFIEAIIIIFIISIIKKYDFQNLKYFPEKGYIFPLIFFILRFISLIEIKLPIGSKFFVILNMIGMLLLFIYIYLNLNYDGMLMMGVGLSFNFFVMIINGGKMPIDAYFFAKLVDEKIYNLTYNGYSLFHTIINNNTNFPLMGDVIPLLKPYIFPKIVSIGDIVMATGFIILFTSVLKGKYTLEKDDEDKVYVDRLIHHKETKAKNHEDRDIKIYKRTKNED